MKLAFRKTDGPGISGLFNRYTKWSLKTGYAHGGVLIGDQLWHTTTHGVMPELFEPSEAWDLFDSGTSDKIALERCTKVLGMRYDPASLLGFKLPIRVTDVKGLYCFELQWLALTGEHPRKPISPDTVMAELLRRLNNAQTLSARTALDRGPDGHGGFPDTIGARFDSLATEHGLPGFGVADLHVRHDSNLGIPR